MDYKISLVGNPNVGKTSLYNRITRSFEHVGNWHGVTVEKSSKHAKLEGKDILFTDLPGLYSLTVYSPEEGVTRDSVLSYESNLIINVCEVNNLARNLYLTLQLLECGVNMILAVNMIDELKLRSLELNAEILSNRFSIPVFSVSAKNKALVNELCVNSLKYLDGNISGEPFLKHFDCLPLNQIAEIISQNAKSAGLEKNFAAIKVMENDSFILDKLALNENQITEINKYGDLQPLVAKARYEYIDVLMSGVIVPSKKAAEALKSKENKLPQIGYIHGKSKIDKFVLNKYLAIPIFLCLMAAIFFVTFGLIGKFLSDMLALFIERVLYLNIKAGLESISCPSWITALVCEGVILGVGGVLEFLPQIVLLFFFLAVLEDSGYLSRVAFMTDGIFRKLGLSGRASFTLLMGFGCSAAAVLTTRGLEDENTRKKTILLTPFMSCSARLPVYSVIAAAFFSGSSPLIVFLMYVIGIAVSLLLAATMEKLVKPLKSGKLSFVMEMPPYRIPTFERVFQIIKNNVKVFIIKVGTIVFALNVIVWVLSNFSLLHGFVQNTSYKSIFETFSSFIAPLFSPLGFGNWRAVTALLSGVVAKEIVISSIESLGGVNSVFTGEYAHVAALSFMVFTLLYVPCLATLTAIKKETSLKWMLVCLSVQLSVAYICSLIFYWAGRLFVFNTGLAAGILIITVLAVAIIIILINLIKNRGCGGSCGNCKKNCYKINENEK